MPSRTGSPFRIAAIVATMMVTSSDDCQSGLQREHVDREEDRSDQLLMRSVASRDQHRVAMAAQDVGLLVLVERAAELPPRGPPFAREGSPTARGRCRPADAAGERT